MKRGYLDDLRALVAVAQERSFTRAAAKLGLSQSALSQTIRDLEVRLGSFEYKRDVLSAHVRHTHVPRRRATIDHRDVLLPEAKELEEFVEVCLAAKVDKIATVSGDLDLTTPEGLLLARILGAVNSNVSPGTAELTV